MTRQHTCTVCGHTGPWGKGWEWYGSLKQIDESLTPVFKVCDHICKSKAEAEGLREKYEAGL